jgi:hypothetical protein
MHRGGPKGDDRLVIGSVFTVEKLRMTNLKSKKTNLSHFQSGRQTCFSKKYIFIFISIRCKEKKRRINLAPYLLGDSMQLFIIRKESH